MRMEGVRHGERIEPGTYHHWTTASLAIRRDPTVRRGKHCLRAPRAYFLQW